MAQVTARNRNQGKVDKNGKAKKPNWEYRFEAAKTDGKRNQITKSGFRTKAEALEAGTKALAQYNNAGLHFEPTEISVSDFFDYWMDNYCKTNVGDGTLKLYRYIINKHLRPRIGHYKLKAVSTLILQEQLNNIHVEGGFTKGYTKNILKVIRVSFKYA